MKSIEQTNFSGKKVLVRVDYNVPLNENFQVTDVTRIKRTIPTVSKITGDGGIAILMSHLGRPKGQVNDSFSLKHILPTVSEILGKKVVFAGDVLSDEAEKVINSLKPGDVALLENLRFHAEEEKGNPDFAKAIARLGDVYVNDAFGTAHREHASTATIAKFFPHNCFAGHLLYDEASNLEKLFTSAQKPFTAIIGGSKVSTKLNILKNLVTKVDNLIIGGGMSYTFINAMGHEIGDSIFEPDMVDNAKEILATAEKRGVKLYLPVDYVIANDYREDADKKTTQSPDIPAGWQGMDIGPKTTKMFASVINSSKTILWNGPVGVFEWDTFAKGTCTIALCVSAATIAGAYSLIGGGDSIAAVNKANFADHISYISTGGGAMLEYLEGIELPGIKALNDNE